MKLLPYSLRPSAPQCPCHGHPWLAFLPEPRVRDNLIRVQERYDEDELCSDIQGFWNLSATDNMLIVWGKPSDPRNWEVTESFTRKLG
ncbi:hypothetical protein BDV39DRAFT_71548 [Aspergillus sergii]|uniref:Uncharacterized protein n=1 Tax=Aspergillus sergii TaxID=1034303 RepID=A0A5N6X4L1_9EURO|nr:hypothetical protein BDV39DRAFT_71548 [Aspergillus sergii]